MTAPRRSGAALNASARPRRKAATSRPRPAAVPLAPDVAATIAQYQPRGGHERARWPELAPVVRAAVTKAAPVSTSRAIQLLGATTGLLTWCAVGGHSTELGAALSGPSIDAFVASRSGQRTARTMRSRLHAVASANGVAETKPATLPSLSRTPVAEPYTDAELGSLLAWCQSHPTHGDLVLAAIVLGVGAGLDGREQHSVTGQDVLVGPRSLLVRAPGVRPAGKARSSRPPRLVPVVAEYEDRLARLAQSTGSGPLIGTTAARARDFNTLAVLLDTGLPRLEAGRLRATWLAGRLHARVPLAALSRAGAGDIDRALAALAGGVDASEFQDALRGTACCASCPGAAPFDADRLAFLSRADESALTAQLGGRP